MGLTQLFLVVMVAGIALAVVFCIASMSAEDSSKARSSTVFAVIAAIFAAVAVASFGGSIASLNKNSRETTNRCTESGGYVARVDEVKYCLETAPPIKWKL